MLYTGSVINNYTLSNVQFCTHIPLGLVFMNVYEIYVSLMLNFLCIFWVISHVFCNYIRGVVRGFVLEIMINIHVLLNFIYDT